MFNRRISFLLVLSFCFLFGMATKAEVENVKEEAESEITTTESDKGYKIEVSGDSDKQGETKEIKFVSPEGKVVKTLEKYWYKRNVSEAKGKWITEVDHVAGVAENKNAVLLWKGKYSTDYDPRGVEGPHGKKHEYTVELLNKNGETAFKKDFKAYPHGELTMPFWETGISEDGSTFFVFYEDSLGLFHIEIYNATGKKLAEAEHSDKFYGGMRMQISPDGKIFGAKIYKKGAGKYLFFLDVEIGETKMVKAEGEVNGKKWSVSHSLIEDKKIHLSGGWHYIDRAQSAVTSFGKLPKDLSTLFGDKK